MKSSLFDVGSLCKQTFDIVVQPAAAQIVCSNFLIFASVVFNSQSKREDFSIFREKEPLHVAPSFRSFVEIREDRFMACHIRMMRCFLMLIRID